MQLQGAAEKTLLASFSLVVVDGYIAVIAFCRDDAMNIQNRYWQRKKSAAKAWQSGCGGRRTEETYTHSFSDSLYLRLSKWTRLDIFLGPNGTEVLVKQATTLSSQERSIVKQVWMLFQIGRGIDRVREFISS